MRQFYLANAEWTPLTLLASSFQNEICTERDTQFITVHVTITQTNRTETMRYAPSSNS
jgi:hypothetical protein